MSLNSIPFIESGAQVNWHAPDLNLERLIFAFDQIQKGVVVKPSILVFAEPSLKSSSGATLGDSQIQLRWEVFKGTWRFDPVSHDANTYFSKFNTREPRKQLRASSQKMKKALMALFEVASAQLQHMYPAAMAIVVDVRWDRLILSFSTKTQRVILVYYFYAGNIKGISTNEPMLPSRMRGVKYAKLLKERQMSEAEVERVAMRNFHWKFLIALRKAFISSGATKAWSTLVADVVDKQLDVSG